MARQRVVYVIEFKAASGRKWFETGCYLSKREALNECKIWSKNNPNDKFRVNEYFPRD